MKKIISLLIISFLSNGITKAQVIQHLTLKNGSLLNGYVQKASNGELTFHSENATIFIENANVDTPEQTIEITKLDSAWVKWGEANDAIEGVGTGRTIILNNIAFHNNSAITDSIHNFVYYLRQKHTITNVKVLEKGVHVKYLEMTPNTYTLIWDDIASIQIDKRPKTALSGINCKYSLRSGETCDGQQAGETENTLSLYTTGGVVQTYNIDDVIKYNFYPINPKQDIFEQSELLDVIKRRNNASDIEGIIIEQSYSSDKDEENYVLIQQESGAVQSVKISEMIETQKKKNNRYHPLYDILLKEGDFTINRQKFQFVNVKESEDIMKLDSICFSNVVSKGENGTSIIVEYRDSNGGNVIPFQLVKVTKGVVKKHTIYSFNYKDLVNSVTQPTSVTTSINQTTKAEYLINGQGVYALYDAKKHRAIPIIIKPKN